MFSTHVKRILIPTDFSDCSQEATRYAASLAKAFKARAYLLHVTEPAIYGLDFSLVHPKVLPGLRQQLVEVMQQWVDGMRDQGIEAEGQFVTGVPFMEIIKAAKKVEADLIVMGTHGRTGLAHILLGSTAERVIQRALCPVLTVKSAQRLSASHEKETAASEQGRALEGDILVGRGMTFCHLCAQPSQEIICEVCKIRVQAEAFEKKQRIEKEGRVETGRR